LSWFAAMPPRITFPRRQQGRLTATSAQEDEVRRWPKRCELPGRLNNRGRSRVSHERPLTPSKERKSMRTNLVESPSDWQSDGRTHGQRVLRQNAAGTLEKLGKQPVDAPRRLATAMPVLCAAIA
jgi:hypothetical protein